MSEPFCEKCLATLDSAGKCYCDRPAVAVEAPDREEYFSGFEAGKAHAIAEMQAELHKYRKALLQLRPDRIMCFIELPKERELTSYGDIRKQIIKATDAALASAGLPTPSQEKHDARKETILTRS